MPMRADEEPAVIGKRRHGAGMKPVDRGTAQLPSRAWCRALKDRHAVGGCDEQHRWWRCGVVTHLSIRRETSVHGCTSCSFAESSRLTQFAPLAARRDEAQSVIRVSLLLFHHRGFLWESDPLLRRIADNAQRVPALLQSSER